MATAQERNRGMGAYSTPGVDTPADGIQPFKSIGSAPSVQFKTSQVDPPSFVYIGREDRALITLTCTNAANVFTVIFRIMRPDGVVVINSFNFTQTGLRVVGQFVQELTEGFLLGVSVFLTTGVNFGNAWAGVQLLRGLLTGNVASMLLCKGPCGGKVALGWPYGPNKDLSDGVGAPIDVIGATPAAGADISETMPTFTRRRLRTISATLVTSAGVANREAALSLLDAFGTTWYFAPSGFTQAASLTHRYTWALGGQPIQGVQQLATLGPAPDLYMIGGCKINTNTINIQAGDQWSAPEYEVEEWADNL